MSSIRSVVLPSRNGLRYRSTAGLTRSARCVKVAQPYPKRPSWSVEILTTVSRTPAGWHSITLTSLIFGMGMARVARAACSCAIASRGLARPSSPAAPIDPKKFLRWIDIFPHECFGLQTTSDGVCITTWGRLQRVLNRFGAHDGAYPARQHAPDPG